MQLRDFKSNSNIILLGSVRSNPWVSLFDPNLNFVEEYRGNGLTSYIRNRSPNPGEAATYSVGPSDGGSQDAYAVVALQPNLARNGRVLIIAGLTMEGTEAAGDLLTSRELCDGMLRGIGVPVEGPLPPFEVLLKLRAVGGASRDTKVIAFRRYR
jgi:hypothetical protein